MGVSSTVYFLSDLHIRNFQDEKAQKLLRFFISLKKIEKQTQIFLVGDIFDLWLGSHSYFIEKMRPLCEAISEYVQNGGQVYYFEGNHDLHLKNYWQNQLGVHVCEQPQHFQLQGYNVRVEHGDQMDPEDTGYIFLRWFLRTFFMKWIILHLPGMVVAKIGEWASQQSRSYTDRQRNEQKILKVIRSHAHSIAQKHAFDAIITGHVHLRDDYHFDISGQKKRSFNLGSWDHQSTILKLENQIWSWITL